MRSIASRKGLILVSAAAAVLPILASASPLKPARRFSVKTTVAIREVVAAAVVNHNKVHLLITDRGLTGRSAILLETDTYGADPQWRDLNVAAHGLVKAGTSIAASLPILNGVRVLQPATDEFRATDLTGLTANATGTGSRLIRLLGNGDLAVHDVGGGHVSAPRILPTSTDLKIQEAPGAYTICPLPGDRLAIVHRSSASFKIVDLNTSRVLVSLVLDNEDLRRGRAMFAKQQESFAAMRANSSNPALILGGDVHSSGDMFFLTGPFTPAEGARVLRVNSKGAVVASLRCLYPAFNPDDGPPQFVGVNNDDLYLISSRGHISVYSLSSATTGT
jgi:hypothetical protein